MSAALLGVREAVRVLDGMDRRVTKERQVTFRKAATVTLVRRMKAGASGSPGRAGVRMSRSVSARNGRNGTVAVGPRSGKRGAWFRHFFIGGAKAHAIDGKLAAHGRSAGRRRLLYNPAGPFLAHGPVMHPGLGSNPFVAAAIAGGTAEFVAEVSRRLADASTTRRNA